MVQGTSSHAGKSVLTAALCRIFARDGYQVAPFKAQNMSLNSFVTPDGGEIGRSQAVQAAAAMVEPRVEMNPVLLKPEAEARSQVVVMGRPTARKSAREYYELKQTLWPSVTNALDTLRREFDVVVIEGAGSPAEINLKQHDIVNMRVGRYANAPVLLVGDIDRAGVFAQIVGTMTMLEPEERALVTGHVINKFRGDPSLLESGLHLLHEHTGAPALGVPPYYTDIQIPEEDSLGLDATPLPDHETIVDVAVVRLPHIANFDDFDPLRYEPGVRVRFVHTLDAVGKPDLIVLPGSKTTVDDLDWLRANGLAGRIVHARGEGTPVIGICAGFQMLGGELRDPDGVESPRALTPGLALLPTTTTFHPDKTTHQVAARVRVPHPHPDWWGNFALDAALVLLAVTLDRLLPEPPAAIHPVVWMGRTIRALERFAPVAPPFALLYGGAIALTVVALWGTLGWLALTGLAALGPVAYVLGGAVLLRTAFTVRGLTTAGEAIRQALNERDLESARHRLQSLVSRDRATLAPPLVAAAAIESVAENTTDSFVAPWLAFGLLGPAGAVLYRAANTLDSMLGHHGRYEYLGKASARFDDLLNLIPARLSALLMLFAGALYRFPTRASAGVLRRDRNITESPNAGWTMSAMAGLLGKRLEKPDHYVLGKGLPEPAPNDIARANRLALGTALLALPVAMALLALRHWLLA